MTLKIVIAFPDGSQITRSVDFDLEHRTATLPDGWTVDLKQADTVTVNIPITFTVRG